MPKSKHSTPARGCVLPPIRCSEEERQTIRERAAAARMTQSEYLRTMAVSGRVVMREAKADTALIFQLQRVGVNLNQIAHTMHAHSGKIPDNFAATLDLLDTVLINALDVVGAV
jgi:hypothetical protein